MSLTEVRSQESREGVLSVESKDWTKRVASSTKESNE